MFECRGSVYRCFVFISIGGGAFTFIIQQQPQRLGIVVERTSVCADKVSSLWV